MDPGPDLEAHHRHHTGRLWLDTVLAVSAIAISLFSAVMTLQNGKAMERMVEANSWPYVTIDHSDSDAQGQSLYQIQITNNGVGPAKIESRQLFYKGRVFPDFRALALEVSKDAGDTAPAHLIQSDTPVIPARQSVNILDAPPAVSASSFIEALKRADSRIDVKICYCSIFHDCWAVTKLGVGQPTPVKQCPRAN